MSVSHILLSLAGVSVLATLHLSANPVARLLEKRRGWLSAAAGLSVAYVLVHLLPDVAEQQARWLETLPHRPLRWLRVQVYLAALLGLLAAHAVRRSRRVGERGRFGVAIGVSIVYHLLVGSAIARMQGSLAVIAAVLAFGCHFAVDDQALRREHGSRYARVGSKLVAVALVIGWGLGFAVPAPSIVGALALGLLAGVVLLDVLGEELPGSGGRVGPFAAGALGYTALLLGLDYLLASRS